MKTEVKEEFHENGISYDPDLECYKVEPIGLDPKIAEKEQELDTFKLKPCDKDRIPLSGFHFAL